MHREASGLAFTARRDERRHARHTPSREITGKTRDFSKLIRLGCSRARFILRNCASSRSIENAVMNLNAALHERHALICLRACTNSEDRGIDSHLLL